MEWLAYLVFGIISIFILIFIIGFTTAALSSKKRFDSHALKLFNQLSNNEKNVISKVWFSYKKRAVQEANEEVTNLSSSEIRHIKELFDPDNRPRDLSGGRANDNAITLMYINIAKEIGLNEVATNIIAGIGLHGIEKHFN